MYQPQMSTWMAAYSPNRFFVNVGLTPMYLSISTWKYWCTLETTCYSKFLSEFYMPTQIVLMPDYKQTRLSIEAHLERSITLVASVMIVPQQQPTLTCSRNWRCVLLYHDSTRISWGIVTQSFDVGESKLSGAQQSECASFMQSKIPWSCGRKAEANLANLHCQLQLNRFGAAKNFTLHVWWLSQNLPHYWACLLGANDL